MSLLKFPLLYENSQSDMDTLGFGYMTGIVNGTVTRDRNAIPVLEMDYRADDYLAGEIKNDRVIVVDGSQTYNKQQFRIAKIAKTMSESGEKLLRITANHIAGDILFNSITEDVSLANSNPTEIFEKIRAVLSTDIPQVSFYSDILQKANFNATFKETDSLQEILFDQTTGKDSFGKLFDGEWLFDNSKLYFNKNAGRNTGLVIKYGSNLKTIQQDEAVDETYTAVQPWAVQHETIANTDVSDAVDYQGVGLVQYVGAGGIPVWTTPNGAKTNQVVTNGTYVNIDKKLVDADGVEWLQIGNNQWINSQYIMIDNKGAYITNEVKGQGTVRFNISADGQSGMIEQLTGVLTVQYMGKGGVAIWTSPFEDKQLTGKYLSNGSNYKVFAQAKDYRDHVWYSLGGNQWIDGNYISFDKKLGFSSTPATGQGTIKYSGKGGVAVWDRPSHKTTGKYLNNGTRWKIFSVANTSGGDWYNLGGNQWVNGSYMSFDSNKDIKPRLITDDNQEAPRVAGKIPVWKAPNHGRVPTGEYKYSGDKISIFAQATTGEGVFYKISETESWWVEGKYITFDNVDDVNPYSENQDVKNKPEVIVKLPEVYLEAETASKFEKTRVIKFDASNYNVDTEDKLREVTRAYMYDNDVGIPKVALTVDYYQMRGELEELTNVNLYDYASVYFPQLDINTKAEVTRTVWNVTAKRYDSISFGKRPENLKDTLDKYTQNVREVTKKEVVQNTNGILLDLNLQWEKINQTAKETLELKQENLNMADVLAAYKKSAEDEINRVKDELTTSIANKSNQITYGGTAITAQTSSGGYLSLGADGIVYSDAYGTRIAIGANGKIYADGIVGNTIEGIYINGGTITGGTITGVSIVGGTISGNVYINSKNGSSNAVMSWEYGFSTTEGLNVGKTSSLHGNVNVDLDLKVSGVIRIGNATLKYLSSGYKGAGLYANAGHGDVFVA